MFYLTMNLKTLSKLFGTRIAAVLDRRPVPLHINLASPQWEMDFHAST